MNRKLRMGMIGGGQGSFVGSAHRIGSVIDNKIELVCGAFSSTAEKSYASGKELLLPDDRIYGSFEEMIAKEKELDADKRMDFVSIVTPNHLHFAPAKMALENGFHVICDKPVTFSLDEAKELAEIIDRTNLIFALTHTFSAYAMVKQAREMIKNNLLGKVRKVVVAYPQGWLATFLEASGNKQAGWRTDPKRSGAAGTVGDIGTHASNLAEYVTGLQIEEVCADLSIFVEGRLLDDDANVLLRFNNGAKGVLHCSQISVGEDNDLNICVYGEKGGLEWHQENPGILKVSLLDQPTQIYKAGSGLLHDSANALCRMPSGLPEGYFEAFANIYRNFANAIEAYNTGAKNNFDYPTIEDGLRGMLFIEKVVESGKSDQKWTKLTMD